MGKATLGRYHVLTWQAQFKNRNNGQYEWVARLPVVNQSRYPEHARRNPGQPFGMSDKWVYIGFRRIVPRFIQNCYNPCGLSMGA